MFKITKILDALESHPLPVIARIAAVTAAVTAAVAGLWFANVAATERDRYTPVAGVVVDDAPVATLVGRSRQAFKAWAADANGERVQVTVDRDARRGDAVTLYRDGDTGGLYRPSGVANDPYTNVYGSTLAVAVVAAMGSVLVSIAAILAAIELEDRQRRRQRRRQRV